MSAGPLRRTTGTIGLLGLLPIAAMLVIGSLTPEEAAVRASAVFLAVLLIGNVTRWVLVMLAGRFERGVDDRDGPTGSGADAADISGHRRASDAAGVTGDVRAAAGVGRRVTDRGSQAAGPQTAGW